MTADNQGLLQPSQGITKLAICMLWPSLDIYAAFHVTVFFINLFCQHSGCDNVCSRSLFFETKLILINHHFFFLLQKSAPFFLPTIPGLVPVFDVSQQSGDKSSKSDNKMVFSSSSGKLSIHTSLLHCLLVTDPITSLSEHFEFDIILFFSVLTTCPSILLTL